MALVHLDTSGMTRILQEIDALGGKAEQILSDALEETGEQIGNDTAEALSAADLPRLGKYSTGDTMNSVIRHPKTHREGSYMWIPVGFNFAEPGAGGFLIGGTPKMEPDAELQKMYKGKKYMRDMQEQMADKVMDELLKIYEGS